MHHDNCQQRYSTTMTSERPLLKLASSASEQNVYFTYVCLVNDFKHDAGRERMTCRTSTNLLNPDTEMVDYDDQPIQVERSKALHELIESHKEQNNDVTTIMDNHNEIHSSKPYPTTTSGEDSELSENDEFLCFDKPNILKLTKMKWLSEGECGSPDSSSPILSPVRSTTSSVFSQESVDDLHPPVPDKYLSTILRLDKEHNLFGLSSITIIGSKLSRKLRRDEIKPVFPQTAIVQICCANGCSICCAKKCCRHKTNTDLPASLKCGSSCRSCTEPPYCSTCAAGPPCVDPLPCRPSCTSCRRAKCSTIALHRKPKFEPFTVELTPRSSCVLQKPAAARTCHHTPQCQPPSSCFPYLMPCYWPARASAPCSSPARCFHNPPCLAARKRSCIPPEEKCPKHAKCDFSKKTCPNIACPGKPSKILSTRIIEVNRLPKKIEKPDKVTDCECSEPVCASCFVSKPKKPTDKS